MHAHGVGAIEVTSAAETLNQAYDELLRHFGPQGWWPAGSEFEMAVGAILTQNTAWTNVEKALTRLREEERLTPGAMHELELEELAELIRASGYHHRKAARLRNFTRLIVDDFDGDFSALLALPPEQLRERLLGVNGIGPETADSIILYAAGGPIFVIDNYTARVAKRHGWVDFDADYHQMQEYFQGAVEENVPRYREFHALIVRVAKVHCGTRPDCVPCPLRCLLPPGGPLEPT